MPRRPKHRLVWCNSPELTLDALELISTLLAGVVPAEEPRRVRGSANEVQTKNPSVVLADQWVRQKMSEQGYGVSVLPELTYVAYNHFWRSFPEMVNPSL